MRFREKLIRLCEEKGWNQTVLASKVTGLSKAKAYRWWNGETEPVDGTAVELARVLGVPLEYLADDDVDEVPARERLSREDYAFLEIAHGLDLRPGEVLRRLRLYDAQGGGYTERTEVMRPGDEPLVIQDDRDEKAPAVEHGRGGRKGATAG